MAAPAKMAATDEEVLRFCGLLAIQTTPVDGPSGPYAEAVAYVRSLADALGGGVTTTVHTFVRGKPVLVVTWPGREPALPSILLNCHYDVVPALDAQWRTPPFEPTVGEDGRIYARGTQDMKSVCMQYVEALRRWRHKQDPAQQGSPFRRTVHLSFMPDEEVGGGDGAGRFTQSDAFRALNVGVALDEGLASPTEAFTVFYGERAPWFLTIKATGPTGHGSRFIENPAAHKIVDVINKALAFRAEQEARLDDGCSHGVATKLGDVVSLNLTALRAGLPGPAHFGGFALNVVPPEAEAGFDIRIPPTVPMDMMERTVQSWLPADGSVVVHFHAKVDAHNVTSTDPAKNPWWAVFSGIFEKHGWSTVPEVFPAATDSRYLRALGIPCFGFSPMNHTPILLHDNNEYLDRDVYLRGITVYEALLQGLADA